MVEQGLSRKRMVLNIVMIVILSAFMLFVFRNDYKEIWESIRSISIPGLFLLLAMGIGYQLLDSAMCLVLLRQKNPAFRYGQAVDLTFLGVFGSVLTSSAGNVPVQSYYLYEHGVPVGSGVGIMALKYVLHKTSIFLYAVLMVFTQRKWLRSVMPETMLYIKIGMVVCALIVVFLLAFFTWEKVYRFLLYVIQRLPDKGKWIQWKFAWSSQLEVLYKESRTITSNRYSCCKVILLNFVKLFWLYLIPFLCMEVLDIPNPGWGKVQVLASAMLILIGVLPNVAGMGPAEFAFLKLFTPCIGRTQASSSLILYRIATYFFPFLLSAGITVKIQKKMIGRFYRADRKK